jgi:branched-chain amino acid transport system permease protein
VMYSTSRVLSVTTGHLCMLGGVVGAWLIAGLGLPGVLGLAGAVLAGAAAGAVTEIVGVRRVLARSDEHLWLLSTLALATMLQQAVGLWWGTEPRPFPRVIPQDFSAGLLDQKYWLPVVAVLAMTAGLEAFTRLTLWGKLFQATSEDAFAARARGIPTDRVRLTSYLLAGGLGSNLGALVGGAGLGLLSAFATYWFGGEYQQTIAVGLLMLVLLLRPEGLLGNKRVRPV